MVLLFPLHHRRGGYLPPYEMSTKAPSGSTLTDYTAKTLTLIYRAYCEVKRDRTLDAVHSDRLEMLTAEMKHRRLSLK